MGLATGSSMFPSASRWIEGLRLKKDRIDSKIAIQARLGRSGTKVSQRTASGLRKRRTMSAAARKRIADAQRKRWAAYHKERSQV
jgi:hypothetical protein